VSARCQAGICFTRGLAAGFALLAVWPAAAQETRESDFTELERQPGLLEHVRVRATADNRFVGPADFGAFEATSNQPEARLRVDVPVTKNAGFRLQGTGRMILYDFTGDSSLSGSPPGEAPFRDLYSWDTRLQGAYLLDEDFTLISEDERWALLAQAGVGADWEESSSMNESLRPNGGVALGYRWRNRLEVAVGVTVGEDLLDGGVNVGPLVEFDWRITDAWTVRSHGLGLQVERRINESWKVYAQGRLEGRSFRLADRGPGIGKGALHLDQLPVGIGAQWKTGHLRVRALIGGMFLQEIQIEDEDGSRVDRERAPPSPYVTLRFDLHD
jgi:hypothetical protein